MAKSISKARWDKLRQRMTGYGIQDVPITALPENLTGFTRDIDEAAGRLMILLAVAFSASNAAEADKIADWLKTEELWQLASENEKSFLREPVMNDEELAKLSFRFEGAYMLAWVLGQVDIFPDPSSECDMELVTHFFENLPPLLSDPTALFENADYRKIAAVHDEYLFYKMAALYFTHINKADKENTSNVHRDAAYQRFFVLEWLLNPLQPDWDEMVTEFYGGEYKF